MSGFFTHFQWSNFKSNHRFGILASVIAVLSKIVHNSVEADVIKQGIYQLSESGGDKTSDYAKSGGASTKNL